MSILGHPVKRTEDPRFITGTATFGDDVNLPGALHATFVRSYLAHARITGIDTSGIGAIPGAAAFTAADVDLAPMAPGFPGINEDMKRPVVAADVVRHAGEIVAVVVTEQRLQGPDAAELVGVELEDLPSTADPAVALAGDPLLFEELGTNVCARFPVENPDEHLFDGCDVVASFTLTSQRLASCPMECRVTAARREPDGRLTCWTSTQTPNGNRDALAVALGLDPEQVRVIAPDVGGGFGPKVGVAPEDALVAWLALRLDRPVRWTETRSENMLALGHGRAQCQEITIGGTRDGKVLAYRMELLQDAGAYPAIGAILPMFTHWCAIGAYGIEKVEVGATSVVTNTTPVVAYRGAGRPEAIQAIERAMDVFAAETGLDPAEVRRRNYVPNEAFPYDTPTGVRYDTGDYERALDLALEHAGYEELRAEQRRRREAGAVRQLGIGLSSYIEVTNPFAQEEWGAVEITADGGALVRTGLGPTGQGHQTALAMLVAERLGLPFESIDVRHGDTDVIPRGVGTFGSRSLQVGGTAVDTAAERVVEKARELAADHLEASTADLRFDAARGEFHVAGVPAKAISWAALASTLEGEGRLVELAMEEDFKPESPTWPFGTHIAVVEVDTETGRVRLVRMVCVDDCGTVLNPLLVDGQRHGGVAQGAAQALCEEFAYDAEGNPQTDNFVTYPVISAADLPAIELVGMATPTPINPLGAKGIGESGTIGSTPAVHNAVIDALAGLGVRHLEMPATPLRVWETIRAAGG
jgi:aerobic carbon-monoxide dehydrogenase large subunit